MISRINMAGVATNAVGYNEDKVIHEEASLLAAVNTPFDDAQSLAAMTYKQKVGILDMYAQASATAKEPFVHISLSFHPNDAPKLNPASLTEISTRYMNGMGYENIPFFIYQHTDRPHPHVHIVGVSVDELGKRVRTYRNYVRSTTLLQSLEKEYGLVVAKEQGKDHIMDGLLDPFELSKASDRQVKKAIGNVLQTAIKDYNFSRLSTYEAFLSAHHVEMNQLDGKLENGKTYSGLTYRLSSKAYSYQNPDSNEPARKQAVSSTDTNNTRSHERGRDGVGSPPIKASSYGFKPTLPVLEAKFNKKVDIEKHQAGKSVTAERVHSELKTHKPTTIPQLKLVLRQAGVHMVEQAPKEESRAEDLPTQNTTQPRPFVVFIDHNSRNVYGQDEIGNGELTYAALLKMVEANRIAEQKAIAELAQQTATQGVAAAQNEAAVKKPQASQPILEVVAPQPQKQPQPEAKTAESQASASPLEQTASETVPNQPLKPQTPPQPVQSVPAKAPAPKVKPVLLDEAQQDQWRKVLGRIYQSARENGYRFEGKDFAKQYYESQTIQQFPTAYLTHALSQKTERGVRLTPVQVEQVVSGFHQFKLQQLPRLLEKDKAAIAKDLLPIATMVSGLPISRESKETLLDKLGISCKQDLAKGQYVGFMNQYPGLSIAIPRDVAKALQSDNGSNIYLPKNFSSVEQRLYKAAALSKELPSQLLQEGSYYRQPAERLSKTLPKAAYDTLATQWNRQQVAMLDKKVDTHLNGQARLGLNIAAEIGRRGLVVMQEKAADGSYYWKAGMAHSHPDTYAVLPQRFTALLNQKPPFEPAKQLKLVTQWKQQQLAELSQAVDRGDTERIRVLIKLDGKQTTDLSAEELQLKGEQIAKQEARQVWPIATPPSVDIPTTELRNVPAAGVPAAGVPAAGVPAAGVPAALGGERLQVPTAPTPAAKPYRPVVAADIEATRIVNALLRSGLPPTQRTEVAALLGLRYHAGENAMVWQGQTPLRGMLLTPQQESGFGALPPKGERFSIQLTSAEKTLLTETLGKPVGQVIYRLEQADKAALASIDRPQISRILSPAIRGESTEQAISKAYIQTYATRLVQERLAQNPQMAAERIGLDLYQRGFIVARQQIQTPNGVINSLQVGHNGQWVEAPVAIAKLVGKNTSESGTALPILGNNDRFGRGLTELNSPRGEQIQRYAKQMDMGKDMSKIITQFAGRPGFKGITRMDGILDKMTIVSHPKQLQTQGQNAAAGTPKTPTHSPILPAPGPPFVGTQTTKKKPVPALPQKPSRKLR